LTIVLFKKKKQSTGRTNQPATTKASAAMHGDKCGNNQLMVATKTATATRGGESKRWITVHLTEGVQKPSNRNGEEVKIDQATTRLETTAF